MKRFVVAAALVCAGCASSQPSAPPPSEARLAELQTSMTELLERLDVMNARLTKLEESRFSAAATASAPPAPAPAVQPVPQSRPVPATASRALAGAQIADRYRGAIVLYGQNRFEEARAAFQAVFQADSSGELADNALFWIGETYYAANDWGNAMSYYRRVAQDYSDQNKAPDALYKLALAQIKTGDLALARQTLQDVMARYPYSAPAASAKAELNRIKY